MMHYFCLFAFKILCFYFLIVCDVPRYESLTLLEFVKLLRGIDNIFS